VVLGALAIFGQVAAASGSVGLGLAAVGLMAGSIYGLVVLSRHRAAKQVQAIETTGRFEIDAGLDFDCLPENWPTMARETLNPAGADQVPSLPVRLSIVNESLLIDKKQSWGSGRGPFHAEVMLADVTEVSVGKAQRVYAGSSLTIGLRSGQEVRVDLPLSVEQADALAQRLRQQIPRLTVGSLPPRGIVIMAAPPPLRTSPARAGLLLMAVFLPFPIAMIGAQNGLAAAIASMLLLFYALWLQMTRPPTMHRRLAVGLLLTSGAFVIDAAATGEVWRLIGTVVCLALTSPLLRLAPPSY
jgi:hypothetical protein